MGQRAGRSAPYRPAQPPADRWDSPEADAVKVLARGHQTLVWTRIRHTNRLRHALRDYYPAAPAAFDELASFDALAVLA